MTVRESPVLAGLKRNVLGPLIAALWAVVEIIIGAGRKILRDVGGHGGRVLVKLGDVLQVRTGETQNRTVEGRHLPVVLAVEAHGWDQTSLAR